MAPPAENAALIVVGSGSIFTAIISTWLVLAPPAFLSPQATTDTARETKAKAAKAAKDKDKDKEKADKEKAEKADKTDKAKDEKSDKAKEESDKSEKAEKGDDDDKSIKTLKPLTGGPALAPPRLPTPAAAPAPIGDDKAKPIGATKDIRPRVIPPKRGNADGPPPADEKPE
ncbi:MAG: hypothetical protein U0165_08590 [Polyangiaceae bacterium]